MVILKGFPVLIARTVSYQKTLSDVRPGIGQRVELRLCGSASSPAETRSFGCLKRMTFGSYISLTPIMRRRQRVTPPMRRLTSITKSSRFLMTRSMVYKWGCTKSCTSDSSVGFGTTLYIKSRSRPNVGNYVIHSHVNHRNRPQTMSASPFNFQCPSLQ